MPDDPQVERWLEEDKGIESVVDPVVTDLGGVTVQAWRDGHVYLIGGEDGESIQVRPEVLPHLVKTLQGLI